MEVIATIGYESTVTIWDILTSDVVATLESDVLVDCVDVCFSSCGGFLAAGFIDGTIIVWDRQSWTQAHVLAGNVSHLRSVRFDRNGDRIVFTSYGGTVCVWCLSSDTIIENIGCNSLTTYSACFSDDGALLAISHGPGVYIHDSSSAELHQSLLAHKDVIRSVQFSQDGSTLASASHDGMIIVWDLASGNVLRELRGHTHAVTQVCFNADASRMVSSSWDDTARVWDVSAGKCLLTLTAHIGSVNSCCFSDDGSQVITASQDGTVKIWDGYTGEEMRTLIIRTGAVTAMSYCSTVKGSYI